ncbi:LysR substrate-binding domain-containing protein [Serratia quinivorans]|uniref:LysR substrate-binding domain-containing protein n=1 Tax=Serratia quinivorans TaxID=137545 RepID=UPI0021BD33A8|nr:LysR substrate-binding domain-containing protein [Serratia quinivorans]
MHSSFIRRVFHTIKLKPNLPIPAISPCPPRRVNPIRSYRYKSPDNYIPILLREKQNVRISCNTYFGQHHLAPVLSLMERQNPGFNIWLDLNNQQNDLIADDIDIDIRIGSVKEPHLVAYKIATSFRVLCASPLYLKRHGTPLELDELRDHNCILYRPREESMGLWRLTDSRSATESKVKVKGTLSTSHSDVVKTWAVKNHGIALLPIWGIAPELASGVLVRVLPQYQQSADIIAVIKNQEKKTHLIRTSVDFIKTHLQASLPSVNSLHEQK